MDVLFQVTFNICGPWRLCVIFKCDNVLLLNAIYVLFLMSGFLDCVFTADSFLVKLVHCIMGILKKQGQIR